MAKSGPSELRGVVLIGCIERLDVGRLTVILGRLDRVFNVKRLTWIARDLLSSL